MPGRRDPLSARRTRGGPASAARRFGSTLLIVSLAFAMAASLVGVGLVPSSGTGAEGRSLAASSIAAPPAVQTTCNLTSLSPLVFDTPAAPDSLDPAVSFSVPGWAAVQQVYQTLVQYNQSSGTDYYGVLAKSWTFTPDRFNWTFHLWPGIHFSNGDHLSAYTMWFSLYRALASNSSSQFILSQNFWYPGTTYYSPATEQANAYNFLVNALNTWDFAAPSASELAFMEGSNQSFQVVDASTIMLRVGAGYLGPQPYGYLMATLASPLASAVDPAVVQAHGGVSGNINPWMSTNMLGTGPYTLASFNLATGYSLTPDATYWGTAAAAQDPGNMALRPAQTPIQIRFQSNPNVEMSDLASGAVVGVSSEILTPSLINQLKADPCIVTKTLDPVYSSTMGSWWVYMNQNAAPFNNLSVRRAVAHVIDYDRIISIAFAGYAHRWVGPVPLGYPWYNPTNLAPYTHDVALAQSYMNESPWPLATGYPATINFEYPNLGGWSTVAVLLQSDLAQIGIHLNPIPVTLADLYALQVQDPNTGQCYSDTTYAGGPFPIGLDFYVSDYLSPDDWTQTDALSYGYANLCMAHYANATVDALVLDAAAQVDPGVLAQAYTSLTQILYDNVTDAWLAIPDQFQAYHPSLRGVVANPMGSAPEFSLTMNTMTAVPPLRVGASVSPIPAVANDTATLTSNVTGGTPPYAIVWQMGDGTNVTSAGGAFSHVYAHAGNYTANVTVRDPYGGYATASVLVRVVAAGFSAPPATLPPWVVYAAIGGVLAAVVVLVLLFLTLRRRGARGPPPPSSPPPESPPPPATPPPSAP